MKEAATIGDFLNALREWLGLKPLYTDDRTLRRHPNWKDAKARSAERSREWRRRQKASLVED